ncbi:MAG: cytochrome b/b6 domain-containing protein [Burkholderiaceae bacterium]|nr:cytochrome b/b6 domain-containing protein [Microbacteriaceae bacterium]
MTGARPAATKNRWRSLIWIVPAALVLLVVAVLAAQWLRALPALGDFFTRYPGETELPVSAPVGFPAWLAWQHFLNGFFLLLIIRSGWAIRTTLRPAAHWIRRNTGLLRTKNPPKRISLDQWFHLNLDALWVLNGVVFYVLIFVTGQWLRLVPTTWEVFPNALSAAIQYASLEWPTDNGWVNYNSLQTLAYFTTVFIAAPLAIATGIRLSGAWPRKAATLNRLYPVEVARAIHVPVMVYFVAFIVVHVTLVLATGALRNLNHMYAGRDDGSWVGLGIFALSVLVLAIAWVAARPLLLRPLAALTGSVSR